MKDLASIVDGQPMADSRDLVDVFGIQHRSIYRLIKIHEVKLKRFGKVRFEITSSDSGQNQSMAYLNEAQSILLLTYTKSNEKTDGYRIKLVSDFIKLREHTRKKEAIRLAGIEVRKSLTDSVQESGENERMHGHGFSQYTTMVYEICGIKAKYEQFKTDWPKRKDFRDTQLDSDQLKRVELAESLIKPLLELEKQYSEIKVTLKPLFEIKK
jgi:phage regulator Rha-like protein